MSKLYRVAGFDDISTGLLAPHPVVVHSRLLELILDTCAHPSVITSYPPFRKGAVTMKAKIVRIGNSQGIRIPKSLLHQCHLDGPVEIDVEGNRLIVRSASRPRSGWDDAFRAMHQAEDDRLLDRAGSSTARWDREEWQW
jgi:antitoxin MazE